MTAVRNNSWASFTGVGSFKIRAAKIQKSVDVKLAELELAAGKENNFHTLVFIPSKNKVQVWRLEHGNAIK